MSCPHGEWHREDCAVCERDDLKYELADLREERAEWEAIALRVAARLAWRNDRYGSRIQAGIKDIIDEARQLVLADLAARYEKEDTDA
jgi:hypothetical protein